MGEAEGWGYSPEFSRAELTYMLDGICFPDRRESYLQETQPSDSDLGSDSDVSDEGAGPFHAHAFAGIPAGLVHMNAAQLQMFVAIAQQMDQQFGAEPDEPDEELEQLLPENGGS